MEQMGQVSRKVDNIGEYLRGNGIKPSYQRIKIFEFLMNTKEHPTVDTIYKSLVTDIPTLSKTTVYNTLNLFVENNIALLITIEENETRYDADISVHGHFKCDTCGRVADFSVVLDAVEVKELSGFQIDQKHVYFKGICDRCVESVH